MRTPGAASPANTGKAKQGSTNVNRDIRRANTARSPSEKSEDTPSMLTKGVKNLSQIAAKLWTDSGENAKNSYGR